MSIIRKEQLTNPLSASYALTASYAENAPTSTINTGSFVTTSSFNAFTSSINQFTASYNTGSFSGSFTGSLRGTASTASYYQEIDPIFVAKSASLATTGSNTFRGNQTISGSILLGSGSIISESGSTTIFTPPGALPGQSLVLRPTQTWNLISDHPNGFTPGDSITITFTPNIGGGYTFTASYVFTDCTEIQLGRPLTGSLDYVLEESKSLSWTIPSVSDITSFTFTIENVAFPLSPDPFITLTRTGSISNEPSHLHLISGNPATTDIYLGDDDQYIKIEKNAGNVVIGTNLDTHQWIFDTSGSLTVPGRINAPSFSGSFTGSLFGTASWAQSASQALTASNVPNALITASVNLNTIVFTKGNNSQFSITINTGSSGGGIPGGTNTTIQFNDSTDFNGSSNFTFNKNTNLVTIQKAGSQNIFPPVIASTTSSLAINGNINVLGKIQTNEANIYTQTFPQIQTLPFDKSFEWDIGKSGSIALITLSDNATDFDINYFGGFLGYAKGTLIVKQDSTGGWSFLLPTSMGGGSISNYIENNGGGTYNPTPDPNAYDILEFICVNKIIFWSVKYNFT
jgi:hypothetical protein